MLCYKVDKIESIDGWPVWTQLLGKNFIYKLMWTTLSKVWFLGKNLKLESYKLNFII